MGNLSVRLQTTLLLLACTALSTFSTPAPAVTLPIEVLSAKAGMVKTVDLPVPTGKGSSVTALLLTINNLDVGEGAVQINGGSWIALDNSTEGLVVEEPAKSYGGIGGAHDTLSFTMPCKAVDGMNRVRLRFNKSNGVSIGYRIVPPARGPPYSINFLTAQGTPVVSPTNYHEDKPNSWKPPYSDAKSIAEGERLWRNAHLTSPLTINGTCSSCHTQNGFDLKFFNFSNYSIEQRSRFHGLTLDQGKLIASFIRTRPTTNPGRPWWPVYQPGLGADSKPVYSWAGGAGLQWVLKSDADTFAYLFPNGITKDAIQSTGYLNVRQLPLAMQLPDWNHWLPRIYPGDAWGAEWYTTEIPARYEGLRVQYADTAGLPAYLQSQQSKTDVNTWLLRRTEFLTTKTGSDAVWTPLLAQKVYSTALWQVVKTWEMSHEFGLEGMGKDFFGPQAESRTWFDRQPFSAGPFVLKIRDGMLTGTLLGDDYLSNAWYQLQLILNPGNKVGIGTSPIDWGYVYGKIKDLWAQSGVGEMARYSAYFVKGMQQWDNGKGLDIAAGWNPDTRLTVDWMVDPIPGKQWLTTPPGTRTGVLDALLGSWLDTSLRWPASDYYTQGYASPTYVPKANYNGNWGDRLLYMLGGFRDQGVSSATVDRAGLFTKKVFPLAPIAVGTGAD